MPHPEWRECPEYASTPSMASGEPWRTCKALDELLGDQVPALELCVYPKTCASCPIPDLAAKAKLVDLLVEAVRAVCRGICDEEVKSGVGGCEHCLVYAALAAVEKAEKEAGGE